MIASGKRNFAIDMSPLDYIYSDTINVLMAMNKRVLDVTGRLSLMAPQPEVLQILKRAGIHNILKIFETETELIKSSEDMILQTTSIQLSDVNAAIRQEAPQSEFDQLRSEIGSVFGSGGADTGHTASPPAQPSQRAGSEEDFNQMFQQFETNSPASGRGGFNVPPVQPQISQPQAPKFQPRPIQQPAAQPIPMRPAAPTYPRQPAEPPKFTPDYSSVRSETQRFTTAPGAPQFQEQRSAEPAAREPISFDDDSSFEATQRDKSIKKSRLREDFDSFDEDDSEDGIRKKSPIPALIIVLLIIAIIGAGGFIAYSTILKKKPETVATVTEKPVQPPQISATSTPSAPPQLPVETSTPSAPPAAEVAPPPEQQKDIVESKPETPPPPSPMRKPTPKAIVRKSTPPPARSEPKPQPTINQVVINSTPPGAAVTINDQRMGTTPFTWTKPFFGRVNIQLSKPGYKTLQQAFEFTGGSMQESYSMEKEVAVAPPPPPPPEPVAQQRQEPVRQTTPSTPPATAKKALAEEDDPFADIGSEEDNFSMDEEPAASPSRQQQPPSRTTPSVATTTPARSTYTPSASSSSSSGGEALIFIASIPPVADVFLGDKLIGKTNVSELKIPAGMQTLKFVKGGKEITKQLNLQAGKNPSQMVRIP